MALFKSSDAEREAERLRRDAERQARERRKAAEQFRQSPLGQAVEAKLAGHGFFQLELEHSRISRNLFEFGLDYDAHGVSRRRGQVRTDLLSQVEDVGWRLTFVNHVWVQKGAVSRDKFLSSGQEVGVTGEVIGIYLFRATEQPPPEHLANQLQA